VTLVLALDRYGPDLDVEQEILARAGATVRTVGEGASELADDLKSAVGLLVVDYPVDAALLDSAPACTVVATYGIGYDNIDVAAAAARGIVVANVPGYCVDEVADHTVALWLACERRIVHGDAMVREGRWDGTALAPMRRLRGLTFGVVGLGRIGREVARRALAFGVDIIAHDPFVTRAEVGGGPVEIVADLGVLLDRADVVSVHVPLTDETRGLLDAAAIGRMKPTTVLLNASRGGIVDEDALLAAIRAGRLAGAGLDVFQNEPPGPKVTSERSGHLVLSPHVAFLSTEALLAARRGAAEAVAQALRSEPVSGRVA
jgi:D-3-phosphoglycerate dehydrogenase